MQGWAGLLLRFLALSSSLAALEVNIMETSLTVELSDERHDDTDCGNGAPSDVQMELLEDVCRWQHS